MQVAAPGHTTITPMMKHPFLLALTAGVLIVLLAFAAPLWQLLRGGGGGGGGGDAVAPDQGLPWQAQAGPEGTLQVRFSPGTCHDGMSEAQYAWDAQASLGTSQWTGCGFRGGASLPR